MNDDEQAIRQLVETWMSATKAGDIETVLGLMTDDVLFMTPGRAPFGKDAFRAQSATMHGVEVEGRSVVEEVEVAGRWAWIHNVIDIAVTREGADAVHRSGHTLTVLKKCDDGRWRLFRDANLVT